MIDRWDLSRDVLVGMVRTAAFERREVASRAGRMLDPTERERADRLRSPGARADLVAGRVLARALLATRAGCEPGTIRMRESPLGCPQAVAPAAARRLRFSIAHSDGIALCAVTAGSAIGADIESIRNVGPDPLAVAGLVCSDKERRDLERTPSWRRPERLLAVRIDAGIPDYIPA